MGSHARTTVCAHVPPTCPLQALPAETFPTCYSHPRNKHPPSWNCQPLIFFNHENPFLSPAPSLRGGWLHGQCQTHLGLSSPVPLGDRRWLGSPLSLHPKRGPTTAPPPLKSDDSHTLSASSIPGRADIPSTNCHCHHYHQYGPQNPAGQAKEERSRCTEGWMLHATQVSGFCYQPKSLRQWILSTYCIPGTVMGTGTCYSI